MYGHRAGVPFGRGIIFPFVVELALRKEIFLSGEDAQLFDPLVTLVADGLPADFVGVLILLDVLRQGMQRPVGRRVGEVEEEGLVVLRIFVHIADGLLRKVVRHVIPFGDFAYGLFAFHEAERVEIVHHAVNRAVELFESAVGRVVDFVGELLVVNMVGQPFALVGAQGRLGDVPLSDHARVITRFAERLGDRHGVLRQRAAVSRQVVVEGHPADAGLMLVKTREQRRAGRAAAARIVESVETQAFGCQPVEVRGVDFTSVAADVRKTQVVGQDYDHIGPRVLFGFGRTLLTFGGRCGQERNRKN